MTADSFGPSMTKNQTSRSLLSRAQEDSSSEAWFQLSRIYEPLIAGWAVRAGISESHVDDISQEVMQTLAQELAKFEHNGRVGAFRKWLKQITIFRCRRYWDRKKREVSTAKPIDDHSAISFLNDLEDPSSDISRLWDEEHDKYVLDEILKLVKTEFVERDFEVFFRNSIKGESAKRISNKTGVSVGNVYKIKFRVITRLKEVAAGLLDGEILDTDSTPTKPGG